MKGPGPHEAPPPDLGTRLLPLRTLDGPWYRIHATGFPALHYGRSGQNRFDPPGGEFGVLYVGRDAHCAFVETFGWATGTAFVERALLLQRGLARVDPSRPLVLVDLTGRGLARLGADGRLTTGGYEPSQAWALALHQHPCRPDGIYYRSRHDPSRRCAALYERAAPALHETSFGTLSDPDNAWLLGAILDHYRFALL